MKSHRRSGRKSRAQFRVKIEIHPNVFQPEHKFRITTFFSKEKQSKMFFHYLQMWLSKNAATLVLLMAVTSMAESFRFQADDEQVESKPVIAAETEAKLEPVETETQAIKRHIDQLVIDVNREERKIDDSSHEAIEAKEVLVTEDSEPEIQGRFFLKDKLCSLGLMDVSGPHTRLKSLSVI